VADGVLEILEELVSEGSDVTVADGVSETLEELVSATLELTDNDAVSEAVEVAVIDGVCVEDKVGKTD